MARTALEGEAYCKSQGKNYVVMLPGNGLSGRQNFPFPYGRNIEKASVTTTKFGVPLHGLVARYNPVNPDLNQAARDHVNYLNQSESSGKRPDCTSDEVSLI